jgi:hypothetical protein
VETDKDQMMVLPCLLLSDQSDVVKASSNHDRETCVDKSTKENS